MATSVSENIFTDPRDGKVYRTVKIGNQVWMAENLNYDAPGSVCYDNDPKYGEKYGRLYDWETAQKAVPPGWHLPSYDEWNKLIQFAGGEKNAGKHLKARIGWYDHNKPNDGNGTDTYSFSAISGGGYSTLNDGFDHIGRYGYWWSWAMYDDNYVYGWHMGYCNDGAYWIIDDVNCLFSVRCIQD
jgi:uncharacterized protein (TIGR02145 family)